MTNYEHLKDIIEDDVAFRNFLYLFFADFCALLCPLKDHKNEMCMGECKKGVFSWLSDVYQNKCPIWREE